MEKKIELYSEIVQQIEKSENLSSIPPETLSEWQAILETHLQELQQINDQESIAIATIEIIIFHLKSAQKPDFIKIEKYFRNAIESLIEGEKEYEKKLVIHRETEQRKLILDQFEYFYVFVEYYLSLLEQNFNNFSLAEMGVEVRNQKLAFLKKHLLLKGNLNRLLFFNVLSVRERLRKNIFLFAFLSGLGIVLMWHGLWGIFDWLIALVGMEDNLFPYVFTAMLGLIMLVVLGVFIELTSGTPEESMDELQKSPEFSAIEKNFRK